MDLKFEPLTFDTHFAILSKLVLENRKGDRCLMTKEPEVHHNLHATPLNAVVGFRLQSGDMLEPNDVYNSTTGKWERCPHPGIILGETETVWVRPTKN